MSGGVRASEWGLPEEEAGIVVRENLREGKLDVVRERKEGFVWVDLWGLMRLVLFWYFMGRTGFATPAIPCFEDRRSFTYEDQNCEWLTKVKICYY